MIYARQNKPGFTIVELLIVIVVIGIIAGITIISYSAVTNNAKKQTAKTDAQTAAGVLTKYKSENGAYPANLSDAGEIKSVQSTYQYTYNSTADTYCLTASVSGASAHLESGNSKAEDGGCAGHGVNGQAAVVNLAYNPSGETNYNGVSGYWSSPVSARASIANAVRGSYQFQTITNSSTNVQGLINEVTTSAKPNQVYRCSISLRGTAGSVVNFSGRFSTSTSAYISEGAGSQNVTLSASWQRVSISFTSPATTGILYVQYRLNTAASGITIQSDALMCTEGSSTYNYGDGTSAGWAWSSTAHGSASSGPAL